MAKDAQNPDEVKNPEEPKKPTPRQIFGGEGFKDEQRTEITSNAQEVAKLLAAAVEARGAAIGVAEGTSAADKGKLTKAANTAEAAATAAYDVLIAPYKGKGNEDKLEAVQFKIHEAVEKEKIKGWDKITDKAPYGDLAAMLDTKFKDKYPDEKGSAITTGALIATGVVGAGAALQALKGKKTIDENGQETKKKFGFGRVAQVLLGATALVAAGLALTKGKDAGSFVNRIREGSSHVPGLGGLSPGR